MWGCLGRAASSSRGGSLVLPPRPGWRELAGRAGMPDPQPQAPHQPTRPPSRPTVGALIQSGRLRWLHRLPLVLSRHATVATVPRSKGRADRPARQQEGQDMTEPSVSFAGNLADQPEVRSTEGGIARAMFRVAVSGRRDQEESFFTVVVWRDPTEQGR